jgi:hypothetical protein
MTKSPAYVSQLKNGRWVVLLPLLGHGLPDEHPDSHDTKEDAASWIAGRDGVSWVGTKLRSIPLMKFPA